MIEEWDIKVYERAIEKWGRNLQMGMCIEECAELIKEINKYWRNQDNIQQLAEELADVQIMCEQMQVMFGIDYLVAKVKLEKMEKLRKMLGVVEFGHRRKS